MKFNNEVDETRFKDLDRWQQMTPEARDAAVQGLMKAVQVHHDKGEALMNQALDWGSSSVGGRRVTTVQRMGNKFERVISDRFGERVITSATRDSRTGQMKDIRVFGMPVHSVNPSDVAEAWGVKFSSPFADVVPQGINRATRDAWDEKRKHEQDEKARSERITKRRRTEEEEIFDRYTRKNWGHTQWRKYNALSDPAKNKVFDQVLVRDEDNKIFESERSRWSKDKRDQFNQMSETEKVRERKRVIANARRKSGGQK